MTFLAQIDRRQGASKERYSEIRRILGEARLVHPDEPGVACSLRITQEAHGRLEEAASRHGYRSTRELAAKALMLGLATLERLPTAEAPPKPRSIGRVLSEEEISRLRSEGFNAPRVPPPPKHYCDDEEERPAVAG